MDGDDRGDCALLTLSLSPRRPSSLPQGPHETSPAPDQPAGLDMAGAGSGPGLLPLGTCPAAPAFAVAPMPTDWPECGRPSPGPVPTDTARPAGFRTDADPSRPVFLAALLLPGLLFSEGPWWAQGQTPLSGQPWGGKGASPRAFCPSPTPSSLSPALCSPVPPPQPPSQ